MIGMAWFFKLQKVYACFVNGKKKNQWRPFSFFPKDGLATVSLYMFCTVTMYTKAEVAISDVKTGLE